MQPDLQPLYNIVESCIADLGIDPATARAASPGQWSLIKGSAKVWVDLWYIEAEKRAYYQVMSPVMTIPATNQAALYQELLEINDKLFAVAFTIYNGWVWLKTIRECDNMDKAEAFAQLTRIGNYADQYDDHLIAKYGAPGGGGGSPSGPSGPNA